MKKNNKKKALKGFQLLSKQRRVEIARSGGIKAHKIGTAHKFTSKEARAAGKKGGLTRAKNAKKK